ncbi:hypothetical protein V4D30_01000 [Thermodesulfovibrio sp. 3907-1M]|uniref:Conjugal transfer protein TrbC n=1 Tax=Thermodesulfovibrio autotrophicus TaxID=3118333 RepID=A0AAU8GWS3_9BACT
MQTKILLGGIIGLWAVMFVAPEAMAIVSTPAQGTFAYDVYKIAVEDILKGPIGFVCGIGAIALGAVNAIKGQVFTAIPAVLGGAALLKADSIVSSLNMIF